MNFLHLPLFLLAGILAIVFIAFPPTIQASEFGPCSGRSCGCHKGYCWSACGVAAPGGSEWCYTTYSGGFSGDRAYQQCSSNHQCYYDRKCAGPCSV
ncbi:hypothetical protein Glove_63g37 [Diversispora epigaea]|uniref:Uncharacterized protein n=1 Tax=Diversispora epigaea TaxID=1348612 RepID=A0A397JBD6_9GLOM|nr:hypothetical protein Glove_63g37 [Diversispora epigaea]